VRAGSYQGVAFTLVGRLQYGYEGGTWNEWHALFDNGRSRLAERGQRRLRDRLRRAAR
jgi:hypothetical protein